MSVLEDATSSSSTTGSSTKAICLATPPPEPPASAAACYTSWNDWDWISSTTTVNYSTSLGYFISTDRNVPITTLCDGRPRALAPYKTIDRFETYTFTNTTMVSVTEWRPPQPTCTIKDDSEDCKLVVNSYLFSSSRNKQCPTPLPTGGSTRAPYGKFPDCSTDTTCPRTVAVDGKRCHVEGDDMRLLYWPVTTVGGLCGNLTTITPTPTAPDGSPNTAVFEGATYTSPSAYYLFNAYAYRNNGGGIGDWDLCGPRKSVTVAVEPTEVSSVLQRVKRRARGEKFPGTSFNFADLNTVPADTFTKHCQHYNWPDGCETISARWRPWIVVPTGVLSSDSSWLPCSAGVPLEVTSYVPLGVSSESGMRTTLSPSLPRSAEAMPTEEAQNDFVN
jgi:hypothetical protein